MNPQQPQDPQDDEQQQAPPQEPAGDDPESDSDKPEETRLESDQLKLSTPEISRLGDRVTLDYRAALGDHQRRMDRWAEYARRWNGTPDSPVAGEELDSNLPVPYIRWNVFTKWAKEMDSLFGDDAQIIADPVGPSDFRKVKKIGRYMTWRVFKSMKLMNRLCVFTLRKILFGRSFAYSPYVRKTYTVRGKEVVDYEGPDFQPLWPDDIIVPAEDHETLHEFTWLIRKVRVTPEQLLTGEEEGRYRNIRDNFKNIVHLAYGNRQREPEGEQVKLEKDEAEAVQMQNPLSSGGTLLLLEWYGRWRMLESQKEDGDEFDLDKREPHETELVVRYLYDLNLEVGVQDLAELYPDMRERRPFVEASMVKDGSYWSAGLGKMLIDLEDDLRQNHNLGTSAGEHTVAPLIFYRPASGLDAETFEYRPKMMIPVDNPSNDVRVENLHSNLEFTIKREQTLIQYGERLSGLTDLSMGRQEDRPNAPKTARATVALLEEGNVRISLDTKVLREDMAVVLAHFWQLEYMFSPASTFFRVTEEDAAGLFPVNDGGSKLEKEDRDGRYDFRLEFASSVWSREADKQETMARYQLDIQNPLIVQNPLALWRVTCDAHEALGDPNFSDTVPEPPTPDAPVNPKEEFNRLLQGEEIHVNPMDNDELHMMRHLADLKNVKPAEQPETHAKLTVHYLQHIDQMQHKKIVQALTERALQALQQSLPPQVMQMLTQQAQLGGQPPPPAPGAPQPGGPPQ
jgi:hypothetical protein